jgi:hypothetical protein
MRRYVLLIFLISLSVITTSISADSLSVQGDSVMRVKPKRAPMGALLRSVAVPGWWQYYNHKYVKSVVVFGAEMFFIVKTVHWWKKTEDQYNSIQQTDDKSQQDTRYNIYRSYRTSRDDYLWAVGLTVFLSMFDAYVDAHLAGFDVDITPDFEPPKGGASIKLSLRF